jgi:hypothetical protein
VAIVARSNPQALLLSRLVLLQRLVVHVRMVLSASSTALATSTAQVRQRIALSQIAPYCCSHRSRGLLLQPACLLACCAARAHCSHLSVHTLHGTYVPVLDTPYLPHTLYQGVPLGTLATVVRYHLKALLLNRTAPTRQMDPVRTGQHAQSTALATSTVPIAQLAILASAVRSRLVSTKLLYSNEHALCRNRCS